MTRTFRYRQHEYANEECDTVDYVVTEVITERDGGIQIDWSARGVSDGERVDQKSTKFHPGRSFEAACAYRSAYRGYTEVAL